MPEPCKADWKKNPNNVEMETGHESLSRAKDRAQLTATGAMSIVNVALLKQIMDQGPEGNPYFAASVGLIATSLALQVVAGVLAIVMGCLTGYYAKHQDDVCDDFCENMCCCRVVCKRRGPPDVTVTAALSNGIEEHAEAIEMDVLNAPSIESNITICTNRERPLTDRNKGCCPCFVTKRTLEDFEYSILDLHHRWQETAVGLELQAAKSKVMVTYWKDRINTIKGQMDVPGVADHRGSDQQEVSNQDSTQEVVDLQKKVQQHEALLRQWEISRTQGKFLRERASAIVRNQILKKATFWQHVVNFLFFLVFILNTFITGIGIVGNDDQRSSDASQIKT